MQEIRWGIIGCGDVTEIKSGPAFNKVANSRLVAVMRRDAEKAKDYAQRHQVPKWYSDVTLLINDPEVNAIYIATPPSSHAHYTQQAFLAGKPVYVEKPMAMNYAEAKLMSEAAHQTGMKLTIAHYRRAQPFFLKIKELLANQVIGDLRMANLTMLQPPNNELIATSSSNWRTDPTISGGGLFHDLAPHQLDLMLFYFGAIESFHGISLNQAGLYQADDLVIGQILFKNKIVFSGNWCFTVAAAEAMDCCEIFGSLGKISFPIFGHEIKVTIGGKTEVHHFEPIEHVQQPMIEKVVAYFLGKADNPCSAADALQTMELLDGFTQK